MITIEKLENEWNKSRILMHKDNINLFNIFPDISYIYIHLCISLKIFYWNIALRLSQNSSVVKNLPAVQEMPATWVRSLGQEDPLEEAMATHSSIPAWRVPWTEEPGRLQPKRAGESQRRLSTHARMFFTASWCFLPDDKADQPHVDVHPLFLDSSPLGHQRVLGGVPWAKQ